jgi:hypothetical protein
MQKDGVQRDKKYLEYIITNPCLVPGCGVCNRNPGDGLIAYHHFKGLRGGGMSIKPPDYHAIPLCDEHHTLCHSHGMAYISLDTEFIMNSIIKYLIGYITI